MSTTIDQRVVEMRFDNKHFENNVQTSLSTLDKLKQSLNLTGAAKGLENVSAAARKFDISPLSTGVETVRAKFSALEVMAVTTLANITNSAVNAGKRIAKALTIEPVTTGFSEYETKINAIQTIMSNTASKGTTMEDVTRVLNELNTYADKTIYNFAEMTKNIGTFTAAGVGLEESAAAIQGISNLAAASGSTSQQASTAMYQLSQALSTGVVKLMDWNSVVNAGMGGEKFQEALKSTAREYGVAVDDIIKKNGSFRDSLHEEWLTAEILNTTLQKFTVEGAKAYADSMVASGKYTREQADALIEEANAMNDAATKVKTFTQLWDTMKESVQSGWAQTWELIVGDFEEAKEFLTGLSDLFGGIIEKFSNARNALLGGALNSKWDELNGKIEAAGLSTDAFHEKIKEVAKENGIPIDKLIEKYGSLAKVIAAGEIPTNIITKALKGLVGAETTATKSTKELGDVVDRVINGEFGTGKERWDALTKAGYDWAEVQNAVNEKLGITKRHVSALTDEQKKNADQLTKLSDEQLKNKGYTDEQIKALRELQQAAEGSGSSIDELINSLGKPSGRELLLDSVHNVLTAIVDVCKAVGAAWRDAFPPMTSEQLYNIIEAIHRFTENMQMSEETVGKLTSVFKGLFAILDIIATITGGAIRIAFKILCEVFDLTADDALTMAANIGEAIASFRDWLFESSALAKGIDGVITAIKSVTNVVRAWVEAFMKMPQVQSAISRVKSSVSNAFGHIRDYFAEGIARIQEFIQRIKTMDSISIEDLGRIFGDFKENIIDYFFDIDGAVEKVKSLLISFKDKAKECIKSAGEGFKTFGGKVKDILGVAGDKFVWLKDKIVEFALFIKDRFPALIAIGLGVGLIKALSTIGKALELFASPLEGLSDVFDSIATYFKAKAWNERATAMLKFAGAIGILTVCLIALTQVDQSKLWSAVGAIGALMGALAVFTLILTLIDKLGSSAKGIKGAFSKMFDNTGTTLLAMAGALLMLVSCMKMLDGIDSNNIVRNLGILATLAVGLGVLAVAISKVGGVSLSGALGLIAVVLALKQMVGILDDIGKVDINKPMRTLTTLLGLIGIIALLSRASKGMSLGNALGLVGVIISLKMLVNVMEDISELDVGAMKGNLGSFVVVFGALAALLIATRFAGENAAKAGVFIMAVSVALLLITQTLKQLGEMDKSTLEQSAAVVGQILLVFAAIVAVSYFAGANAVKAGVMLIAMAGAILILTGVMYLLRDLPSDDINKAMGVILSLGLMFGVLIGLSALAAGGLGTLIVLTIAVAALAAIVAAFTLLDPTALTNATLCLTMLIGVFALLVVATGLMNSKDWLTDIAVLVVMAIVVGGLAFILAQLAKLETQPALETAAALSLVLLAMSGALLILDKILYVSSSSIGALALVGLVVVEIAVILGVMAALNVNPSIETAAALSILLLGMSATCLILGAVGAVALAAIAGAVALIGVVGLLGIFMMAIGDLASQTPLMEEFLDKGITVLEKIGYGLGSFFGNIIAGFSAGLTAGLPEIGENLATFMNNLASIDPAALDGATALAATLVMLTGASFFESVTSWLTGGSSLASFADELLPFGAKMVELSNILTQGNFDANAVEAAANAGKMLAAMADTIPNSGGLIGAIVGENDLGTFATQIAAFGNAIVGFSNIIAPGGTSLVNEEAVEAAANSGKLLAEMANAIPNSGGLIGLIVGENNMDEFGTQLVSFGKAIVGFSNIIAPGGTSLINEEAVTAAANAGTLLATMADKIPNYGVSVVSVFVGENDMATFGSHLLLFGDAIVRFSNTIAPGGTSLINEEAIKAAANAGTLMTTMAADIPNFGGVVSWFTGDNDLKTFGSQMVAFAMALSDFCFWTTGISEEDVAGAVNAGKLISGLADALPDEGALGGMFSKSEEIDDFGKKMAKFGESLAEFSTSVSTVDTAKMQSVITQTNRIADMARGISGVDFGGLSSFADSLEDLGKAGVDKFVSAFDGSATKLNEAGKSMISDLKTGVSSNSDGLKTAGTDAMNKFAEGVKSNNVKSALTTLLNDLIKAIKNKYQSFKDGGANFMKKMVEGIKGVKPTISDTVLKSVNSAITNVKNKRGSFYDAGAYLVEGFAKGISAKTWQAEAQAAAMAKAALEAAEEALDEHSPSREAYRIGDFFGLGFVNAIGDYKSTAFNASYMMADSAKTGLSKAISKVKDFINLDFDSQPTIRPVLDLSAVESGVGVMSGMFSMTPSVGVLSNVGTINSMMNNRQNGANNDDVISAIKDLGTKIGESSGDSYNVNGITYDDGTNISNAVKSLVRAARVERRR